MLFIDFFLKIQVMAIQFHPDVGDILICDFAQLSTKEPEMVKRRPVINLTPKGRYGRLCTVVPLSTTAPDPNQMWHCKVHADLPRPYNSPEAWVKGDMLYTVSFERLFLFSIGKDSSGKRIYLRPSIGEEEMQRVYACILNGMALYKLSKQLDH